MMSRKLTGGLIVGLAFVVGVNACGSPTGTGGTDTSVSPDRLAELETQLQAKPSLEAAQTEYLAPVRSMADGIAALTPGATWRLEENTWVGCGGEYTQTKAKQAYVMAVFSGPIADAVWPQAVQIVRDGAAQAGAKELGTFKDNPGDHDIYIAGSDGVEFRLGTQKASTLTAKSDCRLSQTDAAPS